MIFKIIIMIMTIEIMIMIMIIKIIIMGDDDDHITCAQVRRKLVGEEDAKAVKQQQGRRRIQLKQAGTS